MRSLVHYGVHMCICIGTYSGFGKIQYKRFYSLDWYNILKLHFGGLCRADRPSHHDIWMNTLVKFLFLFWSWAFVDGEYICGLRRSRAWHVHKLGTAQVHRFPNSVYLKFDNVDEAVAAQRMFDADKKWSYKVINSSSIIYFSMINLIVPMVMKHLCSFPESCVHLSLVWKIYSFPNFIISKDNWMPLLCMQNWCKCN